MYKPEKVSVRRLRFSGKRAFSFLVFSHRSVKSPGKVIIQLLSYLAEQSC